jgi:hypothetical protein
VRQRPMGSEGSSQHSRNPTILFSLAVVLLMLLTACGGSGNSASPMKSPSVAVFSSTPPTAASEGSAYTYQFAASDSAGGSVSFALTAAPTGATLSGSTVSWTPTSAQSRVSNGFTVMATTSGGASATQSWMVTPTGTVRITWVDTFWAESGSTQLSIDWSQLRIGISALVPQPDGSFQILSGSAVNGVFNIPNVPAGYYWLEISPREIYWTSSSNFDMGHDYAAQTATSAPTTSTTNISFQLTGLDPTTGSGWIQVLLLGGPLLPFESTTSPGSSTGTTGAIINGNVDYSGYKNAFMMQYEPVALGPVNGFALGPELSVTDLALINGAVNTINEALNPPVPTSIDLAIKASEWTPLFDHVAPSAPSAMGGVFAASVQPYGTAQIVTAAQNINLIWSPSSSNQGPALPPSCVAASSPLGGPPVLPPALKTDFDAGTVQYSDPFPTPWLRSFTLIQCAAVDISLPGGSSSQSFILSNTQSTPLPTAPVVPLISPVQNPKINGADLFTAVTINSTAVTLSWSPPAIGAPTGYQVLITAPATLNPGSSVSAPSLTLRTKQAAVAVPPSLLMANNTYVFVITALIDGEANMETSPHHSALPVASADVVSAPITINPAQ